MAAGQLDGPCWSTTRNVHRHSGTDPCVLFKTSGGGQLRWAINRAPRTCLVLLVAGSSTSCVALALIRHGPPVFVDPRLQARTYVEGSVTARRIPGSARRPSGMGGTVPAKRGDIELHHVRFSVRHRILSGRRALSLGREERAKSKLRDQRRVEHLEAARSIWERIVRRRAGITRPSGQTEERYTPRVNLRPYL